MGGSTCTCPDHRLITHNLFHSQVGCTGLGAFDPGSVSGLVLAFARAGRPCPGVLSALQRRLLLQVQARLPGGSAQVPPPSQQQALVQQQYKQQRGHVVVQQQRGFGLSLARALRPRELAELMWGLASLAQRASKASSSSSLYGGSSTDSDTEDEEGVEAQEEDAEQLEEGASRAAGAVAAAGSSAAAAQVRTAALLLRALAPIAEQRVGSQVPHEDDDDDDGTAAPGMRSSAQATGPAFTPRQVCMLAWAAAWAGEQPLLTTCCAAVLMRPGRGQQLPLADLGPEELCMLLGACARARYLDGPLWAHVGRHAPVLLRPLGPHHLAAVCTAAVALGVHDRRILGTATQLVLARAAAAAAADAAASESAGEEALTAGSSGSSSSIGMSAAGLPAPALASILAALTRAGLRSAALTQLTAEAVCAPGPWGNRGGAARLSPPQLCAVLAAACASGLHAPGLYGALASRAAAHADSLSAGQLVGVLRALVRARHCDEGAVDALCAALLQRGGGGQGGEMAPAELAGAMWAVGALGAGVFMQVRARLCSCGCMTGGDSGMCCV